MHHARPGDESALSSRQGSRRSGTRAAADAACQTITFLLAAAIPISIEAASFHPPVCSVHLQHTVHTMPKPRPKVTARGGAQVEFQVSPWQSKKPEEADEEEGGQEALPAVQFAGLVVHPPPLKRLKPAASEEVEGASCRDPLQPDVCPPPLPPLESSSSPWITTVHSNLAAQEGGGPLVETCPEQKGGGPLPLVEAFLPSSGRQKAPREGLDAQPESGGCSSSSPSPPPSSRCSGICQLAVLGSGQLSGHLVDARSRKAIGVVGSEVKQSGGGCRGDEDQQVLKIKLLNFETLQVWCRVLRCLHPPRPHPALCRQHVPLTNACPHATASCPVTTCSTYACLFHNHVPLVTCTCSVTTCPRSPWSRTPPRAGATWSGCSPQRPGSCSATTG